MGRIVTFTGPSGSGKTSVVRKLLETKRHTYMVTSLTTRSPRPSDLIGEYMYVSSRSLGEMQDKENLLWRRSHGLHDYATPSSSVVQALQSLGTTHLMILVPEVLKVLCRFMGKVPGKERRLIPIFLIPPPEEELKRRLHLQNRDLSEFDLRRQQEEDWEKNVRNSPIPFRFVSNDRPFEETFNEVCSLLSY